MKISYFDLFYVNTIKMDGYVRKAFRTDMFGVQFKNVSTICHFNLALFQNKNDCHDILVEIRLGRGRSDDLTIDPKWMHGFVKGTKYEELFVEIDGRSFIKGEHEPAVSVKPSIITVCASNAAHFLETFGEALAVGISYKDKVMAMDEVQQLLNLLKPINHYIRQMDKEGSYETEKTIWTNLINKAREELETYDRERGDAHSEFYGGIDTLKKYGIAYTIDKE